MRATFHYFAIREQGLAMTPNDGGLTTYSEAIRQGLSMGLESDSSVLVFGLGVPDPKGVFGTTSGLQERFGPQRVFDIPLAENALTGVAIGLAVSGFRPVLTHQRFDFALVSIEQIVNQAAKWKYMYGGKMSCPIVIRMIVGRGWGQGPQHSQSLQSWFAHIPGLQVFMPSSPVDAKFGMLASLRTEDPTIFIEHRWLHQTKQRLPAEMKEFDLQSAKISACGVDITIVAYSFMHVEAVRAVEHLEKVDGISCELIDLRSLRPLDYSTIFDSIEKTGRLLVVDQSVLTCGIGAEIVSACASRGLSWKSPPSRIGYPDSPTPTSPYLARHYYSDAVHIINGVRQIMGIERLSVDRADKLLDQPDASFEGPF